MGGLAAPESNDIETLVETNAADDFGSDPLTGYGSSSTSNDNQIAVLSTIDYSTSINSTSNLTLAYASQNSSYNYNIIENNYFCQPEEASTFDEITSEQDGDTKLSQAAGDDIVLNSSRYFKKGGKRQVDRIESFVISEDTDIKLTGKAFKSIGQITFASVSSRKECKEIAKTSIDLVYVQTSGRLYFNENGDIKGFGKNGGLFAIFGNSPELTSDRFLLS